MKLKKSLLALTTAATVAVAGTATAVADETPAGSSLSGNQTSENGEGKDEGKDNNQDQSKLAGSADKFFGWKDGTSDLEKMKSVVTLITTIGALVAGLVTLGTNIGKLQNLFK